jgi:hypothetical protein
MKKTLFNLWLTNAKTKSLALLLIFIVMGGFSLHAQMFNYVAGNVYINTAGFAYISTGDTVRIEGNMTTVRDTTVLKRGMLSFAGDADWTSGNNSYVNGYVRSHKATPFIFPIGQGGYRPAAISASDDLLPTDAAYYNTAQYDIAELSGNLTGVTNESWIILGKTPAKITLSWSTDISDLTPALGNLCIAGWNATTMKWEEIPSVADVTSLFDVASNLEVKGSLTTFSPLVPNNYAAYTLGAKCVAPTIKINKR